ncbi:hypothetical protein B0H11DRAFT_1916730 [Mycena galericulata]|nr:hypothetical protein B0H11DRAFT_1916730 [Mycena galericulata]
MISSQVLLEMRESATCDISSTPSRTRTAHPARVCDASRAPTRTTHLRTQGQRIPRPRVARGVRRRVCDAPRSSLSRARTELHNEFQFEAQSGTNVEPAATRYQSTRARSLHPAHEPEGSEGASAFRTQRESASKSRHRDVMMKGEHTNLRPRVGEILPEEKGEEKLGRAQGTMPKRRIRVIRDFQGERVNLKLENVGMAEGHRIADTKMNAREYVVATPGKTRRQWLQRQYDDGAADDRLPELYIGGYHADEEGARRTLRSIKNLKRKSCIGGVVGIMSSRGGSYQRSKRAQTRYLEALPSPDSDDVGEREKELIGRVTPPSPHVLREPTSENE